MNSTIQQKVLFAASIYDETFEYIIAAQTQNGPWDPKEARFRPWALPFIAAIPLAIAAAAVVWLVLRRILPKAPLWASNFVRESVTEASNRTVPPKPSWPSYLPLLCTSLIGLVLYAVTWSKNVGDIAAELIAAAWFSSVALLLLLRPKTFKFSLLSLYAFIFIDEFVLSIARVSTPTSANAPEILATVVAFLGIILMLHMPFRSPELSQAGISKAFEKPDPELRSPEDNLTPWQWMTVSWVQPLLKLGRQRQLNEGDVWFLGLEFHHRRLHDTFRDLPGSVMHRLLQANGLDMIITTFLGIIELLANYASPVLLQQLLRSMQSPDSPIRAAITYALLTFALRLVANQASLLNLWYARRCYERSRGEMITMLYEKTLARKITGDDPAKDETRVPSNGDATAHENGTTKSGQTHKAWRWLPSFFRRSQHSNTIKQEAKAPASMGKILNLMRQACNPSLIDTRTNTSRNDVYEVSQRFWEFRDLIMVPLEVIAAIGLIWALLGWPCLIGASVVVITQVLNFLTAKALVHFEKKRRIATDKKLQSITQFIDAIRHLRWYGWQGTWLEQIIERRQKELNLMMLSRACQLLISITGLLGSVMFPALAFFAFTVLYGHPLTVDIAFPAIDLFQKLDNNVRKIPNLFTVVLNAAVAIGRIEAFMNEPDKEEPQELISLQRQPDLRSATFAWPGSGTVVLRNVSLEFPIGMTVIGGKVGSGKTALLLSLLGELDQISGDYERSSDLVGYCEQRPWLQSMTIRENILFHEPYDDARYKQVIDACALTPDLADFERGDLSAIGENGVGLSGGQRARVALARAVYSNSKILMLDDPLSALDHQTAESIVNKCFHGPLMKDRTLILATHRLDLCRNAAVQYVEVKGGTTNARQVSELPTYANIGSKDTKNKDSDVAPEKQIEDAVKDNFMDDEHRAHGGVQFSVYWEYLKAGKFRWWTAMMVSFGIFRVFALLKFWWLKEWGEAYDRRSTESKSIFQDWPAPEDDIKPWMLTFFVLCLLHAFWAALSQASMFIIVYCAGRKLFKDVIQRVAYAKFRFYDVTPIGRLMNRMTSDIGTIDGTISRSFQDIIAYSIVWIGAMVVVASATPLFLVFACTISAGFVFIFLQFFPSSQSLRRLEMTSLSPLISDFGALLDGLTTVRAFRKQSKFEARVIAVTDNFQRMDHFYWSTQAWLMYRMDNFSALSTLLLTLLGLSTGVSPGLIAFALMGASQLVLSTHGLCTVYGKLQMDFVSVERVVELIRLDTEPSGDITPPASWPRYNGDVVWNDATIRYAEHLDPALTDVSLTIKGGSTTAIIGRTGSGKSTFAAALLATVTPEKGSIFIDGVDISRVDKQALRSRVTFLAQDPVLFTGTIRNNLDPIEEHTDEDCERVLQKICGSHDWSLETKVDTGGRNFSQGQRQLIGLARAILRRSAIVILDEATASIDLATSMKIQDVLREEMQQSTVITIAHRVEAVKDADSCIILDRGRLVDHRSVSAS